MTPIFSSFLLLDLEPQAVKKKAAAATTARIPIIFFHFISEDLFSNYRESIIP